MRKLIVSLFVLGGLLVPHTGVADQALAQAKGCVACHQVDVKLVGPSYREVAAKYQGDAAARDTLIGTVRAGSVGVWGQIPMPPNTTASDEELAVLVDWILGLSG